jgi:pimeloyl-ACP methyl ester carboxylesterase
MTGIKTCWADVNIILCAFVVTLLLIPLGLTTYNAGIARELDTMVDVGTHSLHLRCVGQGRPVVVIDTGVGDPAARWYAFQDRVAQITRVCTYDRAGYGASDPGPMPRHSQQMADELQRLLENAGVRGPYVLVGHSLGGLNVQVFAERYPNQVAGLILLDPTPLAFIMGQAFPDLYQMLAQQAVDFQQMAEAARQSASADARQTPDAEVQAKVAYLEAVASEHAALITESAAQVAGIAAFGDLPLVVVGSDQPNPAFGEQAEAFQQFWIAQSRTLVTKSTHGSFVLASGSSHYLHEDAPDLVLDTIRHMVGRLR